MPFSPIISRTLDFIKPIATNATLPSLDGQDKRVPLITRTEFNNLRALGGYAKRDGVFGAIATMFHRIWNAVKALFGQSDWQRAERSLCTLTKRLAPYVPTYVCNAHPQLTAKALVITEQPHKVKKEAREFMPELISKINKANKELKPADGVFLPILNNIFNWFDVDAINREPHLPEFINHLESQMIKLKNGFQLLETGRKHNTTIIFNNLKQKNFLKPEVTFETFFNTISLFDKRNI